VIERPTHASSYAGMGKEAALGTSHFMFQILMNSIKALTVRM